MSMPPRWLFVMAILGLVWAVNTLEHRGDCLGALGAAVLLGFLLAGLLLLTTVRGRP